MGIYHEWVIEKAETWAKVGTIEKWRLDWFSTNTNEYKKPPYEQITRQTYTLKKENGQWRVAENVYPEATFIFQAK